MSKISDTLALSKDTPFAFTCEKDVKEFLVEFGMAGEFKKKAEGQNRAVLFVASLNHPTHYLLAMQTWDRVSPQENGYTLICTPKSTETAEGFMEHCNRTVKAAEEAARKLWAPPDGRENQKPVDEAAQAVVLQAVALINQGDRVRGEARLEEAARTGNAFAARTLVEFRLADKVVSLAQAGQRTLALAQLDKASQLNPRPSAETLAQLRKLVEPFKEGQFVQPTDCHGWNRMGATLAEAGKFNEAMICCRKAIELDARSDTAWGNLGLVLARLGDYQNALVALDRLIAITPNSANGWHLKGMALASLQKHEEALICYDRALQLDSLIAEAWFNKSLALSNLKEYPDSLKCCNRALELNPRHLGAWLNKARTLYNLGRREEVFACHREMNRIDPVATAALLKSEAGTVSRPK